MRCRSCNSSNTKVTVTEHHKNETWRYCRCIDCGAKYKTIEQYAVPKRGPAPGWTAPPNCSKKGSENNASVLTEANVLDLRRMAAEGKTYVALAKEFGIHKDTVYRIVKRKRWTHV